VWSERGQHGQLVESRQQELQESERAWIGPVDVVDRQHHRRLVGEIGGEPVERVEVRG
jgi:hypothetical protein